MAQESIDEVVGWLQGVFEEPEGLKRVMEALLSAAMGEEVGRHLGASPHQRSGGRLGHRNGFKARRLKTRMGELELSVPQVRSCVAGPYHPSMFARFARSERALLVACSEMYFQGVSTRKVRAVLESMGGAEVSAATVSRVASELDEKLGAFRDRRLDHTSWPYLMIDARHEKVRVEGRVVSQAVLVVVGFDSCGRREVLDWRVGDSESQACWGEVLCSLKARGLGGVELVVSDAHGGIRAALGRHLQGASWQRCRVHFKREALRKVSYKRSGELMRDLTGVFASGERVECLRRGEEMACKWEKSSAGVAALLREGLEDCLTVLDFPEHHRRRLTSTNLLENLMKRLKKRTRVVGVFPGRGSCDRLIGAQLLEVHEGWQTERGAYFNMAQYAGA